MHLDLATVLVLHPLSLIVGAICFLYLKWRAPRHGGLGKMALAFLLLAAGSLMAGVGEGGGMTYGVWTLLSFASGPLAYTLFWIGLRNLVHEKPTGRWSLLLVLPVVLVLTAVVTGFYLVNLIRASVFLSVMSGYALAAAWLVVTDPQGEKLKSRYALAPVLVIKAAIGLATIAGIADPSLGWLAPAQTFCVLILCQFALAMFVLILVQERIESRLIFLSETDALTRIHNRRWFYDRMPQQVAPGDAFLVIDIDHFKSVNDLHGHAAGDHVLGAVAQAMAGLLPRDALFARMGGEEFGLFLPHGSDLQPDVIAERLRQAVAALPVTCQGEAIPVTISLGLAVSAMDKPLTSLVAKADGALYAAKRAGRNRVVRFGDPIYTNPPCEKTSSRATPLPLPARSTG